MCSSDLTPLLVTVTSSPATCGVADGSAVADITGGTSPYYYSWSVGGADSSITGLTTGVYSVSVSDNQGCTTSSSFSVSEIGSPRSEEHTSELQSH